MAWLNPIDSVTFTRTPPGGLKIHRLKNEMIGAIFAVLTVTL
jgi:hypothetical protein